MESDPIAPLVVLPSGHILQVVSSVPAYVSTEHLVQIPFMISVPASVHTVKEQYNSLLYYLAQESIPIFRSIPGPCIQFGGEG